MGEPCATHQATAATHRNSDSQCPSSVSMGTRHQRIGQHFWLGRPYGQHCLTPTYQLSAFTTMKAKVDSSIALKAKPL